MNAECAEEMQERNAEECGKQGWVLVTAGAVLGVMK